MRVKIIGPPGCGKTTKLLELLKKEIDRGTPANRIAFLTFTRAAREEALFRTEKAELDFPYLRTIHAICYRQLNVDQNQIIRPTNLRTFGKFLGVKLSGNSVDPWVEEFDRNWEPPTREDILLQINHKGRHQGLLLKEALENASFEIDYKYAVWFTRAYKAWKAQDNRLDYTDLLIRYLEFGSSLDVDTIFIDEAQDLSSLQWEVVNKLGARAKTWYIAGDDDQSIFHWAGADSSVFQNLAVDATEVLGQSYRVSKAIHYVAMRVAKRIKTRIEKKYEPTASEGEVADIGFIANAQYKEKTFILFRNHYRGHELAHQLKNEGLPFIGSNSPLYKPEVRAALLAWYKLIKKGELSKSEVKKLMKFVDKGQCQINIMEQLSKKTALRTEEIFINKPQWQEWPKYLHGLPGKDLIELCVRRVGFQRTTKPLIYLMSIHQSKGKEAHTVVLDTEISRTVYDALITGTPAQADDEHRVWYTAVTRAKERLFFILPDGPYSYIV